MTQAACEPLLDRLQAALDGVGALPDGADPHAAVCPDCRGRVAAARLVLRTLPSPSASLAELPDRWAETVLGRVRRDRRIRTLRRVGVGAGGLLMVAGLLLAMRFWPEPAGTVAVETVSRVEPPRVEPVAPPPVAMEPDFERARLALRDTSTSIIEPVSVTAPRLIAAATDALATPTLGPVGADLRPVSWSLAEVPEATRVGLEPVTGTAQKALYRLLTDVESFRPTAKPES